MGLTKILSVAAAIMLVAACATPEERAANAQADAAKAREKIAKERLSLVAKYQKCVKDAGADQQKAAACESYLKAADALK